MDEDSTSLSPPTPIAFCFPFKFLIGQDQYGVTAYYVSDTTDEVPDVRKVTREVWQDILAATQANAIATIADALDDTYSVRSGDLPSISHSLACIAAHACPHDGDALDALPSKATGGSEPS